MLGGIAMSTRVAEWCDDNPASYPRTHISLLSSHVFGRGNGFAEIVKHASIKDATMFKQLEQNNFISYQRKQKELGALIQKNALLKTKVVQQDEFEKGDRKLLNFGHTLGHALENQYQFSHGHAISIGMA